VLFAARYRRPVSDLVQEMKYGDKPGIAADLAALLHAVLPPELERQAVVVPVPAHAAKRRERGYNQSELMARELARLKGLPFRRLLVKPRSTRSQTGLERDRRLINPRDCYRPSGKAVAGSRILLVDDVVTTGATLRECALTLLQAGAKEVRACVVASASD
jgi:ComF family protein